MLVSEKQEMDDRNVLIVAIFRKNCYSESRIKQAEEALRCYIMWSWKR